MSTATSSSSRRFGWQIALLAGVLGALAGCNNSGSIDPLADARFREARSQQMQGIQAFDACRNEALLLDSQARGRASAGAFLASARVLERCEADLGVAASTVSQVERMRLHALAVVNFFKGGDVEQARRTFEAFKTTHKGSDLYFGDGTSFIETTEVLLGRDSPMSFGRFAALNVGEDLKRELRRMSHWKSK
jgi:hypothetical protein